MRLTVLPLNTLIAHHCSGYLPRGLYENVFERGAITMGGGLNTKMTFLSLGQQGSGAAALAKEKPIRSEAVFYCNTVWWQLKCIPWRQNAFIN